MDHVVPITTRLRGVTPVRVADLLAADLLAADLLRLAVGLLVVAGLVKAAVFDAETRVVGGRLRTAE